MSGLLSCRPSTINHGVGESCLTDGSGRRPVLQMRHELGIIGMGCKKSGITEGAHYCQAVHKRDDVQMCRMCFGGFMLCISVMNSCAIWLLGPHTCLDCKSSAVVLDCSSIGDIGDRSKAHDNAPDMHGSRALVQEQ